MKKYYQNIDSLPSSHRYYLDDCISNPNSDIQNFIINYPTIYKDNRIIIKILKFYVCDKFILTIIDYNKTIIKLRSTIIYGLIDSSSKRIKNYRHLIFPTDYTNTFIITNVIKKIFRSASGFKYDIAI